MAEVFSSAWQAKSVWEGIAASGRYGKEDGAAGVTITLLPEQGAATLSVPPAARNIFAARLADHYGLILPSPPQTGARGAEGARRPAGAQKPGWYGSQSGLELVWAGVDQWLAIHPDPLIARDLDQRLIGVAAVADQSGARAMLAISGPSARDTLAKGCPVDLHPRAFAPGDAALTSIAHMGVHLWQTEATPAYKLAVFRSLAGSFWAWLSASAAEFGYDVVSGAAPGST